MKRLNIMVLFGTIVTFIGTLIILWATNEKEKESDIKILELKHQNDSLSKELKNVNESISSKIEGDGVCEIIFNIKENVVKLTAVNHSNSMLYNVYATVILVDEFNKLEDYNFHEESIKKTRFSIHIGDMNPDSAYPLDAKITNINPNLDQHNFNVQFSAKNGHYMQVTHLKKVEGNWINETIIDSFHEGKRLFENK